METKIFLNNASFYLTNYFDNHLLSMQTRGWIYENYSIYVSLQGQIYNLNITPKPREPLSLPILIRIIFQYISFILVHYRDTTCFQHNVISVFSAESPETVLQYCSWRLGHKSATTSVHNLQNGPRTRLIRGTCLLSGKVSSPACVTMKNFYFFTSSSSSNRNKFSCFLL